MSEDGSDVQEQVTEQETPDVWLFPHERVQQCADDERAHTFLAPPERVSERRMDADLGVEVETPFPLGPVQQSLAQVPFCMLVSPQAVPESLPEAHVVERATRVPVPRTVLKLVDVPKIRLLQHELQEEMPSRHGSQFGFEDKDHVELSGQKVGIERCRHCPVAPTQMASHGSLSTAACDCDIMVGVDQESCYELKSSSTNDRAWVWSAFDWTSGEVGWETIALEFPTRQLALQFKEVCELVHELNIGPWILAA